MYVKFGIDLFMAITFVLFFNKHVLGGLAFHEMAGLAIAVVFVTHVLLNWSWVKKVTKRLFDKKLHFKTRFGYFLNFLLFISMAFIIISGIFISRVVFPNIDIVNEPWFKITHISVSYLVLILVAIHVGLHWKWVMNVFKHVLSLKALKPPLNVLPKVALAIFLLFGGYQMYATHFFSHFQGITNIFHPFSIQLSEERIHGEGDFKEEHHFDEGTFDEFKQEGKPFLGEGDFRERSDFTPDDFRKGEGRPDFHKGRDGESSNALSVILQYFGIMSVIITIVYYLEKYYKSKKK